METTIKESENINKGIKYVCEILQKVEVLFSIQQKKQQCYYELPRFIYRGITKFYPYKDYDGKGISTPTEEKVQNDYIRSGLSVKLYKNSIGKGSACNSLVERGYIRINYLNSLENMIINARKHYPDQYNDEMSDLNILADIQHNGGATCLVDFSKNVLTALWFACHRDHNDDGFIYCYDIMEDMIVNDNLTVLKTDEEKQPIRKLLLQTYKETNVSSDTTARFCLWEPTPQNARITRQDSIFLFGIEKFLVKEHGVQVIKIPAQNKICILKAMKGLFNITANSIYNDPVGFASVNNKSSLDYNLSTDPYHRGYVNMIRGFYGSALDYLKLWEGNNNENLSDRRTLELCFSLAVCYKNQSAKINKDKIYYDNAIIEYDRVVTLARRILNCSELSERERQYYKTKCTRAMSGIIDLLFELKRYSQAIDYCDVIINEINKGCLRCNDTTISSTEKSLNPRYCKIEKMELLDLEILSKKLVNNERNNYVQRMEEYYRDAITHPNNSFFDNLLIEYYKFVFEVIIGKGNRVSKDKIAKINQWKRALRTNETPNKYENYISWNFLDIKELIDKMDESRYGEKKRYLLNATAYMISFRNEFEMQSWGRSADM